MATASLNRFSCIQSDNGHKKITPDKSKSTQLYVEWCHTVWGRGRRVFVVSDTCMITTSSVQWLVLYTERIGATLAFTQPAITVVADEWTTLSPLFLSIYNISTLQEVKNGPIHLKKCNIWLPRFKLMFLQLKALCAPYSSALKTIHLHTKVRTCGTSLQWKARRLPFYRNAALLSTQLFRHNTKRLATEHINIQHTRNSQTYWTEKPHTIHNTQFFYMA